LSDLEERRTFNGYCRLLEPCHSGDMVISHNVHTSHTTIAIINKEQTVLSNYILSVQMSRQGQVYCDV